MSTEQLETNLFDKIFIYLLLAFAFTIPFITLAKNIFILISLFWIIKIVTKKIHYEKDYLSISILLFIGSILLSLIVNVFLNGLYDFGHATNRAFTLISPFILFLIIIVTPVNLNIIKKIVILFSAAFFCILGYVLIFHFPYPLSINNRLTFPEHHPNACAVLITMVLSMLMILCINQKNKVKQVLLSILILLSLVGLILTYCRAAWIAIILFIIWFTWFILTNKAQKKALLWIFLICITLITIFCLNSSLLERFKSITSKDLPSNFSRVTIWKTSLEIFKSSPIFGVGPDAFRPHFEIIHPNYFETVPHGHNNFLTAAAEYGLIGLISFCLMILAIFKKVVWLYKEATIPLQKQLALVTIVWFMIWFITGMVDYTLKHYSVMSILMLLIALLQSLSSHSFPSYDKVQP